ILDRLRPLVLYLPLTALLQQPYRPGRVMCSTCRSLLCFNNRIDQGERCALLFAF
ncbi:hypothetical protein K469DRAFT_711002, partial [Zopfia rhizophila CBS 207.26]